MRQIFTLDSGRSLHHPCISTALRAFCYQRAFVLNGCWHYWGVQSPSALLRDRTSPGGGLGTTPPHKCRFFWGALTKAVIIVFPAFSVIGISGIWGLRPQTPAGKGRKALPRPIPTHFLPFTNGKNNDLKSLQKPTRVRATPPIAFTKQGGALVGVWGQRPRLLLLKRFLWIRS
jgi:hypothetical protein